MAASVGLIDVRILIFKLLFLILYPILIGFVADCIVYIGRVCQTHMLIRLLSPLTLVMLNIFYVLHSSPILMQLTCSITVVSMFFSQSEWKTV